MVRHCGDLASAKLILARFPNVISDPSRPGHIDAWVLGPGWGDRADGQAAIDCALAEGVPMVIDADALRHLPDRLRPDVVLTPHAGELARMLGVDRSLVEADPVSYAQAAADRWGVTLLLKGGNQIVASPNGESAQLPLPGPAWTAQAGSGDTLAGAIGALLAKGVPAAQAALLAASLQALAAARHPGPIPPDALARRFRAVIASAPN
jgi:hydroxyethylthiazole kinase-like uncharacterized protein yjeF